MELWGFYVEGIWLPPHFQRPLAAKLCVRLPNVLETQERARVLYHHAKFGGARISPAAGWPKTLSIFVCLSVYLFVGHAFERQSLCARLRHEGVGVQKRF